MTAAARRPRAYWEQTLERLLAPIMAEPDRVHPWTERWPIAPYPIATGEFEVVEIHVFGSFARGAADSGDLDVLVVVDTRGTREPSPKVVKRALFGQARQVQVYADRMESTEHREAFPEHRLVWSRTASSLEENLRAIPVVTGAGRFERKTDRLPFPLEVFDTHVETAEAVIDAIEVGEVVSSVIALETITAQPESWHEWWSRNAHQILANKDRQSVPVVLQYLVDECELPLVNHHTGAGGSRRTGFHVNGFYTLFRRPHLSLQPLTFVSISSYLLVPDLPRGSTAGIWRLDRGPSHPLVKAFEDVELWCIGQGAKPALITERQYIGQHWHSYLDRLVLHAYGSRALATKALGAWRKRRANASVVRLRGTELLSWLSRAEDIWVNGSRVSIDQPFESFLGEVRRAREGFREIPVERERQPVEVEPVAGYEGVYRLPTGELLIRQVRKDRATGRLLVVSKRLAGDVTEEDAIIQLAVEEVVGERLASTEVAG